MKLIVYFFFILCILQAKKMLKREKKSRLNIKHQLETKWDQQALPPEKFVAAGYPLVLVKQINPPQSKPGFANCEVNLHAVHENCFSPGQLYSNLGNQQSLNNNLKIALDFLDNDEEEDREKYAYNLAIQTNGQGFARSCPQKFQAITLYTSNNEIFCRLNNFASAYPDKIEAFKNSSNPIHPGLESLAKFHNNLNIALNSYTPTSQIPTNIFQNYIKGKTDPISQYLASGKVFSIRGGRLQALKDYLDSTQKDSTVHFDGFLSTSFDVTKAIEYLGCDPQALLIGFGDIVARGKSAGAMIQDCSVYRAEAEFLLKSNTHWKYVGKVDALATKNCNGKNINIDLHVIEFYEPNPKSDTVQENCVIGDFDNADLNRQNTFVSCARTTCNHQKQGDNLIKYLNRNLYEIH